MLLMEESFRTVIVLILILIVVLIVITMVFGWLNKGGPIVIDFFDWAKGMPSAGSPQPAGPGQ